MAKVKEGVAKVIVTPKTSEDKELNLFLKLDDQSMGLDIIWLDLLFATMHENTQAICITDKVDE